MPPQAPTVRLADFILSDMAPIVAEWEAFAGTLLPAARGMDNLALRDHIEEILQAVAADLGTSQSRQQQYAKSKGLAPWVFNAAETAAQTHATLRARGGFDVRQLMSEYRALRASVLHLWTERYPLTADTDFGDVMRFNEAIDQAVGESVDFFSIQVDQSRNLMLGTLGHDMRSPLQAIQMTARFLAALNAGETVSVAAERLISSGARMKRLVDDLVDFDRIQLGLGMTLNRVDADLTAVVDENVCELRAAFPDRDIQLQTNGEMFGAWDIIRLHQLFSNLIANALTHGAPEYPVSVILTGHQEEVCIEVKNRGAAIDPGLLVHIFQPLRRGLAPAGASGQGSGLGLGLYIASEVAKGHGGRIEVRSDEAETVFTVWLQRST